MFGPLVFETFEQITQCLMCPLKFDLRTNLPLFLKHVFDEHHVMIDEPQRIEDLAQYVTHWRRRLQTTSIERIVPTVDATYYVLSDLLKEDRELRLRLKLEAMLRRQEFEREDDSFIASCLFCKLEHKGKRGEYLEHLTNAHNVRLGNPQNLVYVDELLRRIREELTALRCIYCTKTFTDRTVLKDHMRKKQHKRINPRDRSYDKYYAVNYLTTGRVLEATTGDDDDDYADWNETTTATVTCLFCEHTESNIDKLCLHMSSRHRFNFYELCKHLDFYQKVKLVNYVRRQMHRSQCVYCNETFGDSVALAEHLDEAEHCRLPDAAAFDQPEFYFPTFENDSFLHYLDNIDD